MNIEGQPGAGKTYTAVKVAKLLIGEPFKLGDADSKVIVIDTERNSAELYADEFDFSVIELSNHNPRSYVEAIRTAEAAGAEVIVIDSTTHEWKWCLEEVDRIKPKFGNNKWSAWAEVKPPHENFVDTMMASKAHIIATTRAKLATGQEKDDNGKLKVVKLGLEGIQDDSFEYAYTVVLRMDAAHNAIVCKTRCKHIDGRVFPMPGEQFTGEVKAWLESGDPAAFVERPKAPEAKAAQTAPAPSPPSKLPDPAPVVVPVPHAAPDEGPAIVDSFSARIIDTGDVSGLEGLIAEAASIAGLSADHYHAIRRVAVRRMLDAATSSAEMKRVAAASGSTKADEAWRNETRRIANEKISAIASTTEAA